LQNSHCDHRNFDSVNLGVNQALYQGFGGEVVSALVFHLGMGRYRYQILDTIDTRVLKKIIDTGKKYRWFDISAPAIFFNFGQRHHENDTKKPK
jgi:hypothetical protein